MRSTKWMFLASVSLAACGNPAASPTPAAPAPTAVTAVSNVTGCANGQTALLGTSCFDEQFFEQVCSGYSWYFPGSQGAVKTLTDGTKVCDITRNYVLNGAGSTGSYMGGTWSSSTFEFIPSINPNSVSSSRAQDTQISLLSNDLLSFAASGGWSYRSYTSSTYQLLGLINISSYNLGANCSVGSVDFDLNGRPRTATSSNGSTQDTSVPAVNSENGLAAAFFASDGTKSYLLGNQVERLRIENSGTLKLGFNVPLQNGGCSIVQISKLSVKRCQDVKGRTFTSCP